MILLARGVVGVGIVVVPADVVGREGAVVVRVGLAVGHPQRVPGHAVVARLEVAQQQFVARLVVVGRLRPGAAVLRHVGHAQAEAVRLHALVAAAVGRQRLRLECPTAGRSLGRPASRTDRPTA